VGRLPRRKRSRVEVDKSIETPKCAEVWRTEARKMTARRVDNSHEGRVPIGLDRQGKRLLRACYTACARKRV
jgi:hypothetical protein